MQEEQPGSASRRVVTNEMLAQVFGKKTHGADSNNCTPQPLNDFARFLSSAIDGIIRAQFPRQFQFLLNKIDRHN